MSARRPAQLQKPLETSRWGSRQADRQPGPSRIQPGRHGGSARIGNGPDSIFTAWLGPRPPPEPPSPLPFPGQQTRRFSSEPESVPRPMWRSRRKNGLEGVAGRPGDESSSSHVRSEPVSRSKREPEQAGVCLEPGVAPWKPQLQRPRSQPCWRSGMARRWFRHFIRIAARAGPGFRLAPAAQDAALDRGGVARRARPDLCQHAKCQPDRACGWPLPLRRLIRCTRRSSF